MSKVFVDVGISLDGFIAGTNAGANNPLGDNGLKIHEWMFKQNAFLKHLKLPGDGETGIDNELVERIFNRIGANIMGKNMFVEGEANWPAEAPFHCPVYVLTHEKREPWERPGGTTFYFTDESIEDALKKAKQAAGNRDVRISGGAKTIQQYFNAGLIDELNIHIAPIMISSGVRLFEHLDKTRFSFEIKDVINSSETTHI
ncbi:MAG TPA: dihydrofolate reductase family protein, partial [Ignavibacteriaceae bacterium]